MDNLRPNHDLLDTFQPNHDLRIQVRTIGEDREPVLVVDDFLANPQDILSHATGNGRWEDWRVDRCPGRRADVPQGYIEAVMRRMNDPIRQKLLGHPFPPGDVSGCLAMVTRTPSRLGRLQRVPDADVACESSITIQHFLCPETHGGLGFFRQDSTGFERVTADRKKRYLTARLESLAELGPVLRYPDGSAPGYTRTAFIEARFNRLVAYRSFTLTSAIIEDPALLSADPRTGRLTAVVSVAYDRPLQM